MISLKMRMLIFKKDDDFGFDFQRGERVGRIISFHRRPQIVRNIRNLHNCQEYQRYAKNSQLTLIRVFENPQIYLTFLFWNMKIKLEDGLLTLPIGAINFQKWVASDFLQL